MNTVTFTADKKTVSVENVIYVSFAFGKAVIHFSTHTTPLVIPADSLLSIMERI